MWPFRKAVTLTAITSKPSLVKLFPWVEAKNNMPSWYKSTPLVYEQGVCPVQKSLTNLNATIKSCAGVNSLIRRGFILRAWEDISIVVYPDGTFSSVGASTNPPTSTHSKQQMPSCMQNYTVIKLNSPWSLYGDDTEYLFMPVSYHNALSRKYFTPSGIVSYKHQHATNVFLAVEPKEEPYEILIQAGQPLMQLIPLTKNPVTLTNKYDASHVQFSASKFYLAHAYNRYMNWIKRNGNAS